MCHFLHFILITKAFSWNTRNGCSVTEKLLCHPTYLASYPGSRWAYKREVRGYHELFASPLQNLVALKESLARLEKEVQSSQPEERSATGIPNGTPELNFRLLEDDNRACQDLKPGRKHSNDALSPPSPPPPDTSTVLTALSQDASNSQQGHTHTDSLSDLHPPSDPSSLLQSSLESSVTSDSTMSVGGTSRICLHSQEREVVHFSRIKNGSSKTSRHTDQKSETSVTVKSDWTRSSSDYANSASVHDGGKSSEAGSSPGGCHLTDNSTMDSSIHTSTDNSIHTSADNLLRRRQLSPASRLSPESYTFFKERLNHVPEMNLPWQSMRSVWQCPCGTAFSFSTRKVCVCVCVMCVCVCVIHLCVCVCVCLSFSSLTHFIPHVDLGGAQLHNC